MLLVSTTRIIPGRAVPSFLSGRYPAVKVRKKLYVTFKSEYDLDDLGGGKYRYKEGAVEGGTTVNASLMSGEFILQKTQ